MSTEVSRANHRATFGVLAIAALAFSLLQSMLSPVLPLLQADLHTSQNAVTWVLTAYLLSASVCTPILGRVGDMYGKRRTLVVVLVLLAAGSALAAVASSIGVMIVARAVQGVGGGVIPLSFGIVRDEFPREKVAEAVGVIAALLAVGGGVGIVLAGPIVNTLDYHWLFWIPGAVVAVAAVATQLVIPESPIRTPGRISWAAAVLLSGWLVALLLGVSQAPNWGWGSQSVIGLLVLAVLVGAGWIWVEQRSSHPLIDLRMMRIPAVWTTNLVALLFGMGLYSIFAFLPEFLQTPSSAGYGFGASITESGLIALPMSVSMFIFGSWSGRLSTRLGAKTVMITGSVTSVPAFAIMAFLHDHIWQLTIANLLLGAGFGLAFSAMSNIIVDSVPPQQTGVASGMNANIRTIGGSIGAALMASIITAGAAPNGLPRESGYTAAFGMLAGALVLASVAGLLVPRIARARDAHQREQADMSHPELAIVAGGTLVGDEPE
jgi:EmrB/QacA subfamily drug resistance transporter